MSGRETGLETGRAIEDEAACVCNHAKYLHDDGTDACLMCACESFTERAQPFGGQYEDSSARELLQAWLEYAVTVGIDPADVPLIYQTRQFLEYAGDGGSWVVRVPVAPTTTTPQEAR